MRKLFAAISAAVFLMIIPLCGCSSTAETSPPEYSRQSEASDVPVPVASTAKTHNIFYAPSAIPVKDSARLEYMIEDIYSEGRYYCVTVSGKKCPADTEGSICIDGSYYNDFQIKLFLDNIMLDSLRLGVPAENRFLIMESVNSGLTYGCTLISNKREFSVDEYPDIIQLDFYNENEIEVPQYGRFFTIFDEKLLELPIYENGEETKPCGTHFKLKSAGVMTHCLCVSKASHGYTVRKYEYIFNLDDRLLNKKEVRFYGWTSDN